MMSKDSSLGFDPSLLTDFINESEEALSPLDGLLLSLESSPDNLDSINTVFRPIHSLKGNSAFFGLLKVKRLAHTMENVLDDLRQKHLRANKTIVDSLLQGLDLLHTMLKRVRSGLSEIEEEDCLDEVLSILEAQRNSPERDPVLQLRTLLAQLPELQDHLDSAGKSLLIKWTSHLLQSAAPAVSPNASPILHPLAELLKAPAGSKSASSASEIRAELVVLQNWALDEGTRKILQECVKSWDTVFPVLGYDPILRDTLLEKWDLLAQRGQWHSSPELKEAQQTATLGQAGAKIDTPAAEPERTMRVAEGAIDSFLSYVGELVVVEDTYQHFYRELVKNKFDSALTHTFKQSLQSFSELSENLRSSILAIRRVPARQVFQKLPRLVRDISARTGKEVELITSGENLDLDKSYVEILDAPLTHMLNNAIDHGIENPENRLAVGKSRAGVVRISLMESDQDVVFSIQDDGRGIDADAILQKAVAMGLAMPGQVMDSARILDFLFQPGVSTAKKITEVSGRGVGMDVVRRNIQSVGGRIELETTPGQGSLFQIFLPRNVSTQIIEGFLVGCAAETYVLPVELVGESLAYAASQIQTLAGQGEVLLHNRDVLPILRLGNALEEPTRAEEHGSFVVLRIGETRRAVLVDRVLGIQKVVVKPIENMGWSNFIFDGAAMLGDGRLALIIGTTGLQALIGACWKTP